MKWIIGTHINQAYDFQKCPYPFSSFFLQTRIIQECVAVWIELYKNNISVLCVAFDFLLIVVTDLPHQLRFRGAMLPEFFEVAPGWQTTIK